MSSALGAGCERVATPPTTYPGGTGSHGWGLEHLQEVVVATYVY